MTPWLVEAMQKNFNIELTVFLIFCLLVILSEQPVRSFKYVNCDSIFLSEFFFQRNWQIIWHQGKGGDHFYSSLSLRPTHGHIYICLKLYSWDDYHVFLIASLAPDCYLILDGIYDLKLACDKLMMRWKFNFCLVDHWGLDFVSVLLSEKLVELSPIQLSLLFGLAFWQIDIWGKTK